MLPSLFNVARALRGARSGHMSMSTLIGVDRVDDGRVAVVSFDKQHAMNAMCEDMGRQFRREMQLLSKDKELRALVLTGAGARAFSAGGDLDWILERSTSEAQDNVEIMRRFYSRFLSVMEVPVPTIAALNGAAVGAGMCVALACDMRVAAANARLGLAFLPLGLHPGMAATHLLPQTVGHETAARLLLTGELVGASKAKQIGLVGDVVEEGQALEKALELARTFTDKSPTAVRALTATLRSQRRANLERALQREADAQAHCYATQDLKDCVTGMQEQIARKKK
ncbi:MAG: hypothetical protein MHM6MM_005269 [Cercozoa sp. M6MM]